ncbi:PrsW family intramembrane metalloprotease [Cellulomonas wangsupingiae]|uniref:PrsW family intramembrane metalloprotease n=1 Tax=Cellulomonas wangsupingiae TaxID=2968085 RepID=A0ABY5K492_9CELL|nr:PrsW family intramembrane metalloprotease [Cellulomonas wangsupingiae]MCC2336162.1 PrsW family intramembrane metalloprotease [Cellulomonas wangsupingiae]UUI64593.1 PrsW family intramembrane metalloprotease [Cellulomonas wangsupingiae]
MTSPSTVRPDSPPGALPAQWVPPRRGTGARDVLALLAVVLIAVAALGAVALVLLQVGVGAGVVGTLLAVVPLTVVLLGIRWLDRWEPEPRGALAFGLLWGAGISVLVSLVVNDLTLYTVAQLTGDIDAGVAAATVVSAPIVEEVAKGAGVLVLFLARRRYFDGVVDGLVYAGVVAAGFAFTENILYFGRAGEMLAETFVLRGLATPFAHLLFTACTGAALGLAARSRNRYAAWWLLPLGLLGAIVGHGLWNATSLVAGAAYLAVFAVVQVPLFGGVVGLAFWLRRQESAVIRHRLSEYAQVGWLAPHEVDMLASLQRRRTAVGWATRAGGRPAGDAMRRFQRDATTLAFQRQQAATGRADLRRHAESERELLTAMTTDRHQVLTAAAG